MILGLQNMVVSALAGLLIGGGASWYFTADYKDASWKTEISAQKAEADKQLEAAKERTQKVEKRAIELANSVEVLNGQHEKKLKDVYAVNRRLTAELGGLRDPGRRPSSANTVPSNSTAPAQSETETTGAQLSAEASEFLLEFARQADEAAQYATTCYTWANQLDSLATK